MFRRVWRPRRHGPFWFLVTVKVTYGDGRAVGRGDSRSQTRSRFEEGPSSRGAGSEVVSQSWGRWAENLRRGSRVGRFRRWRLIQRDGLRFACAPELAGQVEKLT